MLINEYKKQELLDQIERHELHSILSIIITYRLLKQWRVTTHNTQCKQINNKTIDISSHMIQCHYRSYEHLDMRSRGVYNRCDWFNIWTWHTRFARVALSTSGQRLGQRFSQERVRWGAVSQAQCSCTGKRRKVQCHKHWITRGIFENFRVGVEGAGGGGHHRYYGVFWKSGERSTSCFLLFYLIKKFWS